MPQRDIKALGNSIKVIDRLAQMHADAATFMDSLNNKTRVAIFKTYQKWRSSYVREDFKMMALRLHSSLLASYLMEEDKTAENSISFMELETPPESEQDLTALFTNQCTRLPPRSSMDQLAEEEGALMANFILPYKMDTLDRIKPDDFKPFGKLRHIYIRRQAVIPDEVYRILKIDRRLYNQDIIKIIWRHLYRARI